MGFLDGLPTAAPDQGRDLWQEVPEPPARYLVTLRGSAATLALSRRSNKPLDLGAALRGELGPVTWFGEAAVPVNAIAHIERVSEGAYWQFIARGCKRRWRDIRGRRDAGAARPA